jgi:hypothetical protein
LVFVGVFTTSGALGFPALDGVRGEELFANLAPLR